MKSPQQNRSNDPSPCIHSRIMDLMTESCQVIDRNWRFTYLNDAAARIGRVTREEVLGRTVMECFPEVVGSPLFSVLQECMENGMARTLENEYHFSDGWQGWYHLSIQPIPEGLFVLATDITEKKRSQEHLYVSEQVLKLCVEYAPASIVMLDRNMRHLAVSRRFLKDFGVPDADIIGKSHYEVFPFISERIRAIHRECLGGQSRKCEQDRFNCPDGSTGWVRWEIKPWYTNDQTVGGMIMFSEVITEQINSREAIRQLNETLESRIAERTAEFSDLYNNAPCGYHSLDPDGVIERINNTALNWLGFNREELVGKIRVPEIMTEQSKLYFKEVFPLLKKTGSIKDVELDFYRKDGTILSLLLNARAVYDQDGNFVTSRATSIDNSDRKHADESLKSALSNLEIVNRELEAFSYSVSHDLRAPLRAINGFAGILSEDYGPQLDEEGKRVCRVIQSNAHKMGRLIDDLLSFSRYARTDLSLYHLHMEGLVKAIVSEMIADDKKSRIRVTIEPLADVMADVSLIKQVWINLIANAIKYTATREMAEIKFSSSVTASEIFYSIEDNGIGFDMNYAHHLFGVFQRLHNDPEFEGTGVGLAIVKRIINRHGGRVWAQGRPGEGAVFGFSLPVQ